MSDADLPFLKRVYAGTRSEELAQTPWSNEEKEAFLKMQFEAQHDFYQQQFPTASYQIVECNGAPIGRLYLDRRPGELRKPNRTCEPALKTETHQLNRTA